MNYKRLHCVILALLCTCTYASDKLSKVTQKQTYKSHWDNPLFMAFHRYEPKIIHDYINAGGGVNDKLDPLDQSLLDYAGYFGVYPIVQFLLNRRANPNTRDNEGKTPLMWAAYYNINQAEESPIWSKKITTGKINAIKELVQRGANINAQDYNGQTALILAASSNEPNLAVISTLLQLGARTDIRNRTGKSAADVIGFPASNIAKVRLLGLPNKPTFFKQWFSSSTKNAKTDAWLQLLFSLTSIIQQHPEQKQKLLQDLKLFFNTIQNDLFPVAIYRTKKLFEN